MLFFMEAAYHMYFGLARVLEAWYPFAGMDTSAASAQTTMQDVSPQEAGVIEAHPKFAVLRAMLQAGVHFGHRTSRWSPNMEPYIHGVKGSVHVINLESTLEKLEAAEAFVEDLARSGKVLLFVGTKPSAKNIVETEAKRCGVPHVTNRWLGGTLTNFPVIASRLKYFLDLEEKRCTGELAKYPKHEQIQFEKLLKDLEVKFGGIKGLQKPPDALFVVDITSDHTAVREAKRIHVPVVALVDTNANPLLVTHPIPANDDAVSSVHFIVQRITDAVLRGKTAAQAGSGA